MQNVVGFLVAVEKCAQAGWDLPGAQRKALSMARYLLAIGARPEDISLFIRVSENDHELSDETENLGIRIFHPTYEAIDTHFNLLFKNKKHDTRLFCYWCGHGYIDQKGNRQLLCQDFDVDNFTNRVFNATNVSVACDRPNMNASRSKFFSQMFAGNPRGRHSV